MVFSSIIFIFFFLPIVLSVYFLTPKRYKNYSLLCISLFFYAWGSLKYLPLLLGSIGVNYVFGLLIYKYKNRKSKMFLIFGVLVNVLVLGFFKYFNFIAENINNILDSSGSKTISLPNVILPIGISFFTFQLLSYILDVHRAKIKPEKNPLNLALYVSLFPHLIAGPIVRYEEIYKEIKERVISHETVVQGIMRFSEGLAKKALIANNLAVVADKVFSLPADELSFSTSWIGLFCYAFQIYFDFSAYSDMAIGLAKIFGFDFPENFNYPYLATSIKDFWARWHMSLSRWFKDYVYIPLGGNRAGEFKTYRNIFIVFLLTGIWHGANWTFVIWGAYYGLWLILEKAFDQKLQRLHIVFRHVIAMLIVLFGWVLFRSDTIDYASRYWLSLVNFKDQTGYFNPLELLNNEVFLVFILAFIFSLNLHNKFFSMVRRNLKGKMSLDDDNENLGAKLSLFLGSYKLLKMLILIGLSAAYLAAGTYNPFIYFRF